MSTLLGLERGDPLVSGSIASSTRHTAVENGPRRKCDDATSLARESLHVTEVES
jgi:hypothetical protein